VTEEVDSDAVASEVEAVDEGEAASEADLMAIIKIIKPLIILIIIPIQPQPLIAMQIPRHKPLKLTLQIIILIIFFN